MALSKVVKFFKEEKTPVANFFAFSGLMMLAMGILGLGFITHDEALASSSSSASNNISNPYTGVIMLLASASLILIPSLCYIAYHYQKFSQDMDASSEEKELLSSTSSSCPA